MKFWNHEEKAKKNMNPPSSSAISPPNCWINLALKLLTTTLFLKPKSRNHPTFQLSNHLPPGESPLGGAYMILIFLGISTATNSTQQTLDLDDLAGIEVIILRSLMQAYNPGPLGKGCPKNSLLTPKTSDVPPAEVNFMTGPSQQIHQQKNTFHLK